MCVLHILIAPVILAAFLCC